jgi:hypothetical protein
MKLVKDQNGNDIEIPLSHIELEQEIAVLKNQLQDLTKRINDIEAGMNAALGKK